jgi:hypothetical protein
MSVVQLVRRMLVAQAVHQVLDARAVRQVRVNVRVQDGPERWDVLVVVVVAGAAVAVAAAVVVAAVVAADGPSLATVAINQALSRGHARE